MKREKRLTKRERKALEPVRPVPERTEAPAAPAEGEPQSATQGQPHIHCVACGRHLDPQDFQRPAKATVLKCQHQATFAACVRCVEKARVMLDDHDRSGQPVQPAKPWH
jgi:hypothetical protein